MANISIPVHHTCM